MKRLPASTFAFLLIFTCCNSNHQRNTKGGLKVEACNVSKDVVSQKVVKKNIRFGGCGVKDVIFRGNGRYEVNSYIELPEPSGKLLRYSYFAILKYKGGDAGKTENWNAEKVFVEVFKD